MHRLRAVQLLLIGSATVSAALPLGAGATPPAAKRIVVLAMRGERLSAGTATEQAFVDELAALGWRAPRIDVIHEEVDGGIAALPAAAARVVKRSPDVIVASGTMQARAASRATAAIPIVTAVADPIAYGFSRADLAPLANVTGTAIAEDFWTGKLRLLSRLVPGLRRVFLLGDPTYDPGWPVESTQKGAKQLGLECTTVLGQNLDDFRAFFQTQSEAQIGAVVVMNSPALARAIAEPLAAFAVSARLAVAAPYVQYVKAGALFSYEDDPAFRVRRVAHYVDRLLRGARPTDLPFERVDRPVISLNVTTAQKLALTVPSDVLSAATIVR